jgi:hypothetical protein
MSNNGRKQANGKKPVNHGVNRLPNGQWPSGVSGNPNGRQPGKMPSELIREMLQAEYGGYNIEQMKQLQQALPEPWKSKPTEKLTNMEILAAMSIISARRSLDAIVEREAVFNRVEGRPVQKIAGVEGEPIEVAAVDWKGLPTETVREVRELTARVRELIAKATVKNE